MPTDIIWTALPNGRDGDRLHLSVHVSPRLTHPSGAGTLADFPALVSWPPPDLSFEVVFAGLNPMRGTIVTTGDPATWGLLFPPSSPVRSFVPPDRSGIPIHTYPVTKIAQFLQDHYSEVAVDSPETFPAIADLLASGFGAIEYAGRVGAERWRDNQATLRRILDNVGAVDTRDPSSATFDFVQLADFFASVDPDDPAVAAVLNSPVPLPDLDFHDAVVACNQHPALLRRLGLVIDLDIDLSQVAVPPAGATTVSVVPGGLAGTAVNTPRTHCQVTGSAFAAVPRPGTAHLAPGWLRLDDPGEYQPVQVEVTGGGIKAIDFAANLQRKTLNRTVDTPETSSLPTLRSDGFMVARLGNAAELHDKLATTPARESALAGGTLELYLDDLVRGYRVDVWDSRSTSWHSLMWRTGEYQLDGGGTVIPVTDEAFIGLGASSKPADDELYVSEALFAWDGWSLAAPRPGKTLDSDPAAPVPLIDRPPNQPGPHFDARIHFDVTPGTLPSLRYGLSYRFRARTVDLAGNSVAAGSSDSTHATKEIAFGRFEPPQTPPVLLRTPRGPGESMETIVVRSNYDVPAAATAERHLIPAKTDELTVERHSMLDVAGGGGAVIDKAAYGMLAARDAVNLLNHPDGDVDPHDPEGTRYYDVASLDVTWLAEPAVRHLALRLLDGPNAGFLDLYPLVADGGAWPGFRAIRLVAAEGAGAPALNGHVLTVPLEKADVIRARLSARLDPAQLDEFGLWHWVKSVATPGQLSALTALVRSGQHWMFEPYRMLTLVHAVRQPLLTPEMPLDPSPSRGTGDTFAQLRGPLTFSRKSTSRIDMLASWDDPVDGGQGTADPADVGEQGSREVEDQTAFSLTIEHDADLPPSSLEYFERHEFGDTKYHAVTYRAVATTRFGEFFTRRHQGPYAGPGSVVTLDTGAPPDGLVPGSVKATVARGDGTSTALVEGRHFTADLAAGVLELTAQAPPTAPGDQLQVVYLVPPVTRETADPPTGPDQHGPRLVDIPSSARPAAPKVVYVLPTFGWETGDLVQGGQVAGKTSTRRGNGLRVYLERPWWTSGAGELLGVVTWPPAELANPPDLDDSGSGEGDPRRPYVTQWGEDPVYESQPLPRRYPRLVSFPDAAATRTGVSLAELRSSPVDLVNVAGHTVGYAADRDLWYCDLTVDPSLAYTPFIRLALARYQPHSISHAHLSSVVLADFIQLAPDRSATVVFDQFDEEVMVVTLTGPTHLDVEAGPGTQIGSAHVIVEQRDPALGPDLGWQQVGNPVPMSASLVGGQGQWGAQVKLPGPRIPGMWRLVVEQFERLGAEPFEKPPLANPFLRTPPIPADRLVHTDIIDL